MLRKLLAVLMLLVVGVYFLASSEGDSAAILDWLRDPSGSLRVHREAVERDRLRTALAPVGGPEFELGGADLGQREASEAAAQEPDEREVREAGDDPLEPLEPGLAETLVGAPDEAAIETLLAGAGYTLRGRLLALDGSPLAGVALEAQQPGQATSRTSSDARGAFQLQLRGAAGALALDLEAWVVLAGTLALTPGLNLKEGERVLVLAPRLDLEGQVVDELGQPLAGVEVHATAELAAAAALRVLPLVPDRSEARTRSDAAGRYRLERLPQVGRGRARFSLAGRSPALHSFEELSADGTVTLTLSADADDADDAR